MDSENSKGKAAKAKEKKKGAKKASSSGSSSEESGETSSGGECFCLWRCRILSLWQVTFSTSKIMKVENNLLIYIALLTYNNQKRITI